VSRPRIRTIKPESQQDEGVGRLSRDARLLFFAGLMTMSDDEGRLRAMFPAIVGHTFPYDEDVSPAKLRRWLSEIESQGMILRYEHNGTPYIAIRHFRRHQRIDKPSPSILPPPPDAVVVAENSPKGRGAVADESQNDPRTVAEESCASRARVGSDQEGKGKDREREQPAPAPATSPIFRLEDIPLPGGDLARLNGSEFVQRRIDGAIGGWLRDHDVSLHADDGILLVRALLKHRVPVTPESITAARRLANEAEATRPGADAAWITEQAAKRMTRPEVVA
jgi:hypothetical protein